MGDSGKMIVAMAWPKRPGPMALSSAGSTMMASGTVGANSNGPTALSTPAIFQKIVYMARAFILGAMAAVLLASGKPVACMVLAPSLGLMAGNIREGTKMTRRREWALFCGQTVAGMRANGAAAVWMAKVSCGRPLVVSHCEASGRLAAQ